MMGCLVLEEDWLIPSTPVCLQAPYPKTTQGPQPTKEHTLPANTNYDGHVKILEGDFRKGQSHLWDSTYAEFQPETEALHFF